MTRHCLAPLALAALLPAVLAQAPKKDEPKKDEPSVRVTRIEVTAEEPAEGKVPAQPGSVGLGLRVTLPGREIVGLDWKSKLDVFADDKGTDLRNKTGVVGNQTLFVGKDRSRATFQVRGRAPAGKAREVRLKADLGVLVGVGEETTKGAVATANGSKVTVGPVEVASAGGALRLAYVKEEVKAIELEDLNGKSVRSGFLGGSETPDYVKNRTPREETHPLPAKLDKVIIVVRAYEKVETVRVPVDVTVGLGLE